jgi:hypothetical protein
MQCKLRYSTIYHPAALYIMLKYTIFFITISLYHIKEWGVGGQMTCNEVNYWIISLSNGLQISFLLFTI